LAIDDISIKKVIVHILDSMIAMPVLSDCELEYGSEFSDFLKTHIHKIISGDDLKRCVFNDENSDICRCFKEMTPENFVESSKFIASNLFTIMNKNIDILPADLVVVVYSYAKRDYLGLLKMNYKASYTHTTSKVDSDDENNKNNNDIIKYKAILPSKSQRLTEAVIIDLHDFSVQLIEKKYQIDGKSDFYLSKIFLNCSAKLSQKNKMSIVTKAVEQVNKKFYEDDYDKAMQAKSVINKEIEEQGYINVNEVADKVFKDNVEMKEAFNKKVDKYHIENETIIPKSKATLKKFEQQHLKTDTGIEIKIPMELYNNANDIEFITNEDGTISVLIKNIGKITSK